MPYRSPCLRGSRYKDSVDRIRVALGIRYDPLLEGALLDRDSFTSTVPSFISRIADIVTVWYVPFLIQEIRQALHYEEAVPAASLLAFSEKPECIQSLARLLHSRRPLDVLVTIEMLGDVVAFAEDDNVRKIARSYLVRCKIGLAKDELRDAVEHSLKAA